MKKMMLLIMVLSIMGYSQELVSKDSNGLIVEVKEKYGGYFIDTCTVVMQYKGNFILVDREGSSGWYPASFHSIRVIGKMPEQKQLAFAQKENSESETVDNIKEIFKIIP